MGSSVENRKQFVQRLEEACRNAGVPEKHKGQREVLSKELGVTSEAIRRWFAGIAMPRPDAMQHLARFLKVDPAWLGYGVAPDMERTERRMHGRKWDGAVHYAWGFFSLQGARCAQLQGADDGEDFLMVYDSEAYRVRVMIPVEQDGVFTFPVKKADGLLQIGVMPFIDGTFPLLMFTPDVLALCETGDGGAVRVTRHSRGYRSGRAVLKVLGDVKESFS